MVPVVLGHENPSITFRLCGYLFDEHNDVSADAVTRPPARPRGIRDQVGPGAPSPLS